MKRSKKAILLSITGMMLLLSQYGCGNQAETLRARLDEPLLPAAAETQTPSEPAAQEPREDVLGDQLTAILSSDRAFLGNYPVDESFLLWFAAMYGEETLVQIAQEAQTGKDPQIWYQESGSSIHVLWMDYCAQLGLHEKQLEQVTRQDCASEDEIVISFTGDLNFDDRTGTMQNLKNNGLNAAFSPDVLELMRAADILMINNECTFSTRGEPLAGKAYTFRSDPENISILKEIGVSIAGIANNHVCDYGLDALTDTITTLKSAGMPYVGAGNNLDEAKKPWYFIANGKKIAFVAATQIERTYNYTKEATDTTAGVLKTLDPGKFTEVIREAKSRSDYVIAFVHWGTEGTNYYEPDQTALAEAFAEAGADAIIGGHTHCLQGMTYIEDVPVIYSLGNFWFGSTPTDGVRKKDTAIVQLRLASDGSVRFRFIPCVQQNRQTYLVTDAAEKARIIAFEQQLSKGVRIDEDGYVTVQD